MKKYYYLIREGLDGSDYEIAGPSTKEHMEVMQRCKPLSRVIDRESWLERQAMQASRR